MLLEPGRLLDRDRDRSLRLAARRRRHPPLEIATASNHNPGNAGLIFYLDISSPVVLIVLLVYYNLTGQARARTR